MVHLQAAKTDTSGIFNSIVVHFRSEQAYFQSNHFKMNGSILTVPTAWYLEPLTQVLIKIELPVRNRQPARSVDCHAVIVDCRPLKKTGQYVADLYFGEIPSEYLQDIERFSEQSHSPHG
jgi:hypothetical protein